MLSVKSVGIDFKKPLSAMQLPDAKELTAELARISPSYAFKLVCKGLEGEVTDAFTRKLYPETFDLNGACSPTGAKKLPKFYNAIAGENKKSSDTPTIGDLRDALIARQSAMDLEYRVTKAKYSSQGK